MRCVTSQKAVHPNSEVLHVEPICLGLHVRVFHYLCHLTCTTLHSCCSWFTIYALTVSDPLSFFICDVWSIRYLSCVSIFKICFPVRHCILFFTALSAFAALGKATVTCSFVMSVRLSACKNSAPIGWIWMELHIWGWVEKLLGE